MIAKDKLPFCPPETDVLAGRKLGSQVSRLSSGAEAEPYYPELCEAGLIRTMREDWIEPSITDKVRILEDLREPGAKQVHVAEKFGISKSAVCHILKMNDNIMKEYENSTNQGRKRQRDGKEAEVGDALWLWYCQKLAQSAHISRPVLKQKATQLAIERGKEFNPSDGWLNCWKTRHNVVQRKEHDKK
ncbi:Tigger transposable element-derived protein 3 [Acipenser ruthenus]|uniref:Tigger transposable element-derived protein 3 n=1 Tax=Acipenser ruthenus TaxID=7906 RepID=A0A444U6B6_ACIRT|nr:Tigger transposable element-derived protein 3 [Acipenser ruthenus]